MSKIDSIIKKLNRTQKIEALIALILSLILITGLTVYSWFAMAESMETMTKVMEPNTLDILAGNHDPIIHFELSGIDIKKMAEEDKAEYRVFSIGTGGYKVAYMLQLAYTTNIPFKYSLYMATWKKGVTEQNSSGTYVEYHPLNSDVISYYEYDPGDEIVLTPLNADTVNAGTYGRVIAKNNGEVYDLTYDAIDDPEIYAVPIYRQSDVIRTHKEGDSYDYYVLKIEWDEEAANQGFTEWNKADNNKETDIIYIIASRQTS